MDAALIELRGLGISSIQVAEAMSEQFGMTFTPSQCAGRAFRMRNMRHTKCVKPSANKPPTASWRDLSDARAERITQRVRALKRAGMPPSAVAIEIQRAHDYRVSPQWVEAV